MMMMLDREGVDKAGDDDGGDDASFECIDAAHEAEGRWLGRGVCCCKDWQWLSLVMSTCVTNSCGFLGEAAQP